MCKFTDKEGAYSIFGKKFATKFVAENSPFFSLYRGDEIVHHAR